jgi:4-amino-4-deoxy-L-arabinose transferase-like glycosyltransferase
MTRQIEAAPTAEDPRVEGPPEVADEPGRRRWSPNIDRALVIVLVIAAVLRWAWLSYARPVPVSDFKHYLDVAQTMLDQGYFGVGRPSAWRLPAYPAFLAVGALLSRDTFFLSAFTGALSVIQVGLTYWLSLLTFRRRSAAIVSGLVVAVSPAFVTFAPVLASEHLLAVCVLGALAAAMKTRRRIWTLPLLAGVLLGAGVLTRGEAGAYLPAVLLVAAVTVWTTRTGPGRMRATLAAATLVVAGVAAVVVPWIVRNETLVGDGAGLSTTGGFNFYLAHSPGPYGWRTPLPLPLQVHDELLRNEFGWTYGLQYVRDHPEDWAPTVRQGTQELLAPSSYAGFYATVAYDVTETRIEPRPDLPLRVDAIRLAGRSSQWLLWVGLLGLTLVPVWRTRVWLAVLGIVLANWLVYAVIFWAQARYRFVVDALACVAVGAVPATITAAASWVSGGWGEGGWGEREEHPTPEQIMRELQALAERAPEAQR